MNKFQKVASIIGASAISNGMFFSTAKFMKKEKDAMDEEIPPAAFIVATLITSGASIGLSLLENLINKNITDDTYWQYALDAAEVLGIFNLTADLLLSVSCKDGFKKHWMHGITANLFAPSLSKESVIAKALNFHAIGQVLTATYIWSIEESDDDWNFFSHGDEHQITNHTDAL